MGKSRKGFNNGISVNFYKLLYFYKLLWYIYLMYVFNAGGGLLLLYKEEKWKEKKNEETKNRCNCISRCYAA